MSRILELIHELRHHTDSPWKERLDQHNIWEDVKLLYSQQWSMKMANTILAFVVLAYDNKSTWIEIHKDRWENKRKIFTRLGGEINDLTRAIIYNENPVVNSIVSWYYVYQTDWRWHSVLVSYEYHAEMMRFAGFRTNDELEEEKIVEERLEKKIKTIPLGDLAKANKEKGGNIQQGIDARKRGDEMLAEMRREFMTLDAIAEKEGNIKLTDTYDPEDHATFIRRLKAGEIQ